MSTLFFLPKRGTFYRFIVGLLIFVIFFIKPGDIQSASITLSEGKPSDISDSTEYQVMVNLTISAADGTRYFLRGVFFVPAPTGTANKYCGYTWNGSSWYKGPLKTDEGWKNFLPVTVSSSSASILLKTRFDREEAGCKESGNYQFKVQRFTEESGSGNFDSQIKQTINVTVPTNTPAPTLKPTEAPTSKPILEPTKTPTSKPAITYSPSGAARSQEKDVSLPSLSGNSLSGSKLSATNSDDLFGNDNDLRVLGENDEATDNSDMKEASKEAKQVKPPSAGFLIIGLIIVGCAMLGVSVFLSFREAKRVK